MDIQALRLEIEWRSSIAVYIHVGLFLQFWTQARQCSTVTAAKAVFTTQFKASKFSAHR